jgi:P-type Cu2+ transporter
MEINLSSLKYLNIEKNLSKVGEKTKSGKWVVKLIVSGIHCISCISTIERRIQSLDGIKKINLHLATNQATVEWDNKIIKFTDWVKEIETLGFQLHLPENLDELSRLEYEQKKLLWNWFVALICTIQIMMFSMPSYVATGL